MDDRYHRNGTIAAGRYRRLDDREWQRRQRVSTGPARWPPAVGSCQTDWEEQERDAAIAMGEPLDEQRARIWLSTSAESRHQ